MIFDWKNFLFRLYLRVFFPPNFSADKSFRHQRIIFRRILRQLAKTELGKDMNVSIIKSYSDFRKIIPVTQYDYYEKYVERIKAGHQKVMSTRKVKWFAKTAGTTSGKSKLVPITQQVITKCHVRGSFFALSKIHQLDKKMNLLGHKNLLIPGGIYETLTSGVIVGDISAISVRNVPVIYRGYYVPEIDVQTLPGWEEKIKKTVEQIKNEDVGTMSGIPTWHLALLNKLKEEKPFDKLTDVWKNLQVFFHGGVSFEPYRKQFAELVGKEDFNFFEVYNATEGFFGIQQNLQSNNLLLLTDNFIFYEFIPLENFNTGNKNALGLHEVKTGVPYVLLITAPNGLVRYMIGDVITFQSLDPFAYKITGRTQEYINAFGEDLLLSNVEQALIKTTRELNCTVRDFTVAPCYINIEQKGRIQFAIEFSTAPDNLKIFETLLDENLKKENSNYQQKRNNDLALSCLEVTALTPGTFYQWLASKNKLGGQNKIPRLVNGRTVIEEILAL